MKIIEVTQDFAFADQGIYVTEYSKGQVAEVSDECAECAIREKWGKPSKKEPDAIPNEEESILDPEFMPEKATEAAPENTAAEAAPEIK